MDAHKMYHRNDSHIINGEFSRGGSHEALGCAQRGDSGVSRGVKKMTLMMVFHRCLFALAIVLAFFQGAVNEGRAQMLEKQNTNLMLNMTLQQLTNLEVAG